MRDTAARARSIWLRLPRQKRDFFAVYSCSPMPTERRHIQQTVSQARTGSVSRCIPAVYGMSSPCGCRAWRPLKPSPTTSPRYLNASGGWLRKVLTWRPMRSIGERAIAAQILNQQGEYALAPNEKQGHAALCRGSLFEGAKVRVVATQLWGEWKELLPLAVRRGDERRSGQDGRSASDRRILPHCATCLSTPSKNGM